MATTIGISTKIKDAMNMMDEGVSPVVQWSGQYYVLSSKNRNLGNLYYTAFDDSLTPLYSVVTPYSFADTVGKLLSTGDSLRPRMNADNELFPAEGYGIVYSQAVVGDQLNQNK